MDGKEDQEGDREKADRDKDFGPGIFYPTFSNQFEEQAISMQIDELIFDGSEVLSSASLIVGTGRKTKEIYKKRKD